MWALGSPVRWAVAVLVVAVLGAVPAGAVAAPPSDCPDIPASPPGGFSDEAAETRELRRTNASVCLAITERQDAVSQDVLEAVADLDGNTADLAPKLTALNQAVAPVSDAYSADELPVSIAEQEIDELRVADDTASEAIDAAGAAGVEIGWYLAGLLVACFAGYFLYRTVAPRV